MQVCPICKEIINELLGYHIKSKHGEKEFKKQIIKAKKEGISDNEIGKIFGITFKQLEKIITEEYGINISNLKNVKKIKYWEPKSFKEECTTIWSFKKRGDWATHNGNYRGNWSPYIPRNVILKYSKPGDIVLDYFVGSGTTAIEAKLLGRRCIARDINPACIELTLKNLNFSSSSKLFEINKIYEPEVSIGDTRDLSDIESGTIDLICAHPPYAGIIKYSTDIMGDLSNLSIEEFLKEMEKVASESLRVLKPGGKCAILLGDTRIKKHIIPIGFKTIDLFLKIGFKLKEMVIKRQHNCKTTGFWFDKSIKYNFLLLAHEYLPIFEKQSLNKIPQFAEENCIYENLNFEMERISFEKIRNLETTTVWILPKDDYIDLLNKNVINRYSNGKKFIIISCNFFHKKEKYQCDLNNEEAINLLFIKSDFQADNLSETFIKFYTNEIRKILNKLISKIIKGGFLVIQTQDLRINGFIKPLAKILIDEIKFDNLWLKEIVIVTRGDEEKIKGLNPNGNLRISHQYLIVYEKI